MTRGLFSALLFIVLVSAPLGAEAWVGFTVPAEQEAASVAALESHGVTALALSNALVEVSAFEVPELRPLATLDSTLTPWDPRWDPWLKSLIPVFQPSESQRRIWVEQSHQDEAARWLGVGAEAGLSPRTVTGWVLISFGLLYLVFRLLAAWGSGPQPAKAWLWLPLTLAVLAGGVAMTLGSVSVSHPPVQKQWLQHLWFQQAFPFGAKWDDWKPGTAWPYRSYQRHEGRIVEAVATLETPDRTWAQHAYSTLDAHAAARLFPPENP